MRRTTLSIIIPCNYESDKFDIAQLVKSIDQQLYVSTLKEFDEKIKVFIADYSAKEHSIRLLGRKALAFTNIDIFKISNTSDKRTTEQFCAKMCNSTYILILEPHTLLTDTKLLWKSFCVLDKHNRKAVTAPIDTTGMSILTKLKYKLRNLYLWRYRIFSNNAEFDYLMINKQVFLNNELFRVALTKGFIGKQ